MNRRWLVILLLPLLGASCTVITKRQSDGGVFRSTDSGDTWQQVVEGQPDSNGKAQAIDRVNAVGLFLDPGTPTGLYVTTRDDGAFYSANSGDVWQTVGLSGTISDLAIDPQTPTLLYAVHGRELLKSSPTEWRTVYSEVSPEQVITTVDVDWFEPSRLYQGTSDGTLFVSEDFGTTWSILSEFPGGIRRFVVSPNDSRVLFAATIESGLWRSTDRGATWTDLSPNLKTFLTADTVNDLDVSAAEERTVYLATAYGLMRSDDLGDSWIPVPTLVEFKTLPLMHVRVNPQNSNILFVTVGSIAYRSTDRGATWSTLETLPSRRTISDILFDPANPSTVFVGVQTVRRSSRNNTSQ